MPIEPGTVYRINPNSQSGTTLDDGMYHVVVSRNDNVQPPEYRTAPITQPIPPTPFTVDAHTRMHYPMDEGHSEAAMIPVGIMTLGEAQAALNGTLADLNVPPPIRRVGIVRLANEWQVKS